jgi:hypothetical protein
MRWRDQERKYTKSKQRERGGHKDKINNGKIRMKKALS